MDKPWQGMRTLVLGIFHERGEDRGTKANMLTDQSQEVGLLLSLIGPKAVIMKSSTSEVGPF